MHLFGMILWFIVFSQLLKHLFALLSFQACSYQAANHAMAVFWTSVPSKSGWTLQPLHFYRGAMN